MAEALYRKYRPQVFEDVVGQEPIERTLKNAIVQDKVSHAYLFTGPRGTGKTTTARLLAKALICEQGPTPDPDGTCEDCLLIADGVHPDVYELDAASRTGVENVREEIISRVSFAPTRGRYKVYIIDEVHMLSTAAFNALLKTLEEPPPHVVFVLCTTDPQKVPETIHSRCQRFDFRRITPESMVSRLGAICIAEDVEFEGEALDLIAHRAEGGLRNALTSLEQIIAFENGKVTLGGAERLLGSIDSNDMAEIIAYVGKRDIANCFRWTAAYVETGADLAQFVRDMAEHVRNLYVMALVGDDVELEIGETSRRELIGELQWFGPDRLARLLGVLGDLSAELKTSSNPRLAFEIALTRMVRPDSDLTLEALAERVEALESGYSSVAHVLPGEPMRFDVRDGGMSGELYGDLPSFAGTSPRSRFGNAQQAYQPAQYGQVEQDTDRAISDSGQMGFQTQAAPQPQGRPQESSQAQSQVQVVSQPPVGSQPQANQQRQASPQSPATQQHMAGAWEQQVRPADRMPEQQAQASARAVDERPVADERLAALANPAALQRVWQAALSALKKQKQAYGVLFMNTKARFDAEAGVLKVVFPEESAFAFNAVQKGDVQDALAMSLAQAAGSEVPFTYEKAGTSASSSAPRAQSRSTAHVQQKPEPATMTSSVAEPTTNRQAEPPLEAAPSVATAAIPAPVPESEVAPAPASAVEAAPAPAYSSAPAPVPASVAVADPTPAPAPAPASEVESTPTPASAPAAANQAVSQSASSAARPPEPVDPYEIPPWEQVPYDEMPYEYVPYEELDGYEPSRASSNDAPAATPTAQPNRASTASAAGSPAVENPADVEAMLQAGFGGGVIFSEVEE